MRLVKRIAIVTGAAGGIGEAIAYAFSCNGAIVVVADMNADGVAETALSINAEGGRASWLQVDVTDYKAAQAMVAETVEKYGRVDILANVAGVGHFGHFNDLTPEEFDRVMRINVNGTFYCAQAAARKAPRA